MINLEDSLFIGTYIKLISDNRFTTLILYNVSLKYLSVRAT